MHVESEGEWFIALSERLKLIFLAQLSHSLTVAARESYEIGTERLVKPELLRKVNEFQHRISSCMLYVLSGTSITSFERLIASHALGQSDASFLHLASWAWQKAKERVSAAA